MDNKIDRDFVAEIDIRHNDRRHSVPPLRFIEGEERPETELLRNDIWELWLSGLSIRKIAEKLEMGKTPVGEHLKTCKERYDKWVTENGLGLHGDPANRLEDTISGLQKDLENVNAAAADCLSEGDMRGYKDLMKLKLDINKEIAKFMGVEPAKEKKIELTSAETTRLLMEEMFSDEDEEDTGGGEEAEE